MIEAININSRLQVTGVINNTNLSYETTVDDILKGEEIVLRVSETTGLPFVFTSLKEEFLEEYRKMSQSKLFPIKKYLMLPWQI